MTDAFGVVSMVAMTPLLTIQMLGLIYQWKLRRAAEEPRELPAETAPAEDEVIDL